MGIDDREFNGSFSGLTEKGVSLVMDYGRARKIGSGSDSDVFLFEGRAIKLYHDLRSGRKVDIDFIRKYHRLTNQAAELLHREPYQRSVDIGDDSFEVTAEVVPIDESGEEKIVGGALGGLGRVETVSKYIPGPRLASLTLSLYDLREELDSVEDEGERQFLSRLSGILSKEKHLTRRFENFLLEISGILNESLGVQGIDIGLDNAKLEVDLQNKILRLVITDLCAELKGLKID